MPDQFSANAQALGYLYQVRYALLLLMQAGRTNPEAALSIERVDDVAFEQDGTPLELIQTKHHLQAEASLLDSSSDLWKTLRIWSVALAAGTIQPGQVVLSLVTTAQAPADSVACWLHPLGRQCRKPDAALSALRTIASTSKSQSNKASYVAFNALSDTQQLTLLDSIQVLDRSPHIQDVRQLILQELRYSARPEHVEAIYERIEGWWFNVVVDHLRHNSHGLIQHRRLQATIDSIREQIHPDNLPVDMFDVLTIREADLEFAQHMFLAQLRLLQLPKPRLLLSLRDYYRAATQRSTWVRESLIRNEELQQYDDRLWDEWNHQFVRRQAAFGTAPSEEVMLQAGQLLLDWAEDLNMPLRRCLDRFLTRGSYHILADALRVGWHLDYQNRLPPLMPCATPESEDA